MSSEFKKLTQEISNQNKTIDAISLQKKTMQGDMMNLEDKLEEALRETSSIRELYEKSLHRTQLTLEEEQIEHNNIKKTLNTQQERQHALFLQQTELHRLQLN